MHKPCWRRGLIVALGILGMLGCRPKENASAALPGAAPPESAAVVAAMNRGMTSIPLRSLSRSHIGKTCVVAAHSPEGGTRIAPPPPPMGMVYIAGPTTVYKGQLHAISADTVEIQAPYPSSGNMKTIPIPRAQIQSIHLAP